MIHCLSMARQLMAMGRVLKGALRDGRVSCRALAFPVVMTAGLLASSPALAGSFTITPVRVFLTPKDRVVAMTVVNEADERLVLQTELFAWSQSSDGQEQLSDSEDLLVAPPIITVPPKGRQVIRLALTKPASPARQSTYRLFVREVVEANVKPKDNEVAIPIALTLSLPIFVTPAKAERQVACSTQPSDSGRELRIQCRNDGNAYAQIRRIAATVGGAEVGVYEGALYILPGARREAVIAVTAPIPKGALRLKVGFDDEREQVFEAAGG